MRFGVIAVSVGDLEARPGEHPAAVLLSCRDERTGLGVDLLLSRRSAITLAAALAHIADRADDGEDAEFLARARLTTTTSDHGDEKTDPHP